MCIGTLLLSEEEEKALVLKEKQEKEALLADKRKNELAKLRRELALQSVQEDNELYHGDAVHHGGVVVSGGVLGHGTHTIIGASPPHGTGRVQHGVAAPSIHLPSDKQQKHLSIALPHKHAAHGVSKDTGGGMGVGGDKGSTSNDILTAMKNAQKNATSSSSAATSALGSPSGVKHGVVPMPPKSFQPQRNTSMMSVQSTNSMVSTDNSFIEFNIYGNG